MFTDVKIGKERMYEAHSIRSGITFKLRRQMLTEMIAKINLILRLRVLQDIFFIKALLMKFELSKRLFVLEIEQGQEVYIPEDMSQRKLPLSFLYYDPVLRIIDSLIDPKTKNFYNLKMQL